MAGYKNSLRTIHQPMFNYPFLVSGTAVKANEGRAMALDTTAENTVKLAADGESIIGPMITFEDRTQSEGTKNAAVALQGGYRFAVLPAADATTKPEVGKYLVGAGDGYVREATATELGNGAISLWRVVEVEGANGLSVVAIKV